MPTTNTQQQLAATDDDVWGDFTIATAPIPASDPNEGDFFSQVEATGNPAQVLAQAKAEAEKQTIAGTAKQQGLLNLLDFFLPDSIARMISTGDTSPATFHNANANTFWGHSFFNPQAAEKDREVMAKGIGEKKYLPYSGLDSAEERAAAMALAQTGDPLTYVGAGGIKTAVKMGIQSLAPSFVGSYAGEKAANAVADMGGSETAQAVASVTSGILTGTTTGVVQTPIAFGAQKIAGIPKKMVSNWKNKDETLEKTISHGTHKINAQVLASQPDLPKVVAQAQRMAERLGLPDMEIAHIAPLVANNNVKRDFESLYTRNTLGFKDKVDSAVSEYNTVLEEYKRKFGGSEATAAKKMGKAVTDERAKIAERQEARAQTLEDNIADINDSIALEVERIAVDGDSVSSGNKMRNLQSAQKAISSKKLSDGYTSILNTAKDKGVSVSPEGVSALHTLHEDLRIKQEFGKGNRFSTLVENILGPKKVKTGKFHPPTTKAEIKNPREIIDTVYPEMDVTRIDTFKRELNLMLRDKNLSPSQYETLVDLKKGFDTVLAKSDPEFASLYKAMDLEYYEQMGVPYSMEGVASMDRVKYAQDAAKKIMKPEAAQHFLAVAGDEGPSVLRHSILTNLRNVMFKDGALDPRALNRWLEKPDNKRLVGLVDGLGEELTDVGATVTRMHEELAGVQDLRNKAKLDQTDALFQALDTNTDTVVLSILNNGVKREEYFKAIESMSPDNRAIVMAGLRNKMISKAMSFANAKDTTIMEHLNDPQYRPAYIKMFGREYFKGITALATIGDSLEVLDLGNLKGGIKGTASEFGVQEAGLSGPNVLAIWRNQIYSATHKLALIASKTGTKQYMNAKDKAAIEYMLSPDFVKQAGEAIEFVDGRAVLKAGSGEFVSKMLELAVKGGYLGGQTGQDSSASEAVFP